MIAHIVTLSLPPATDQPALAQIMSDLLALVGDIAGFTGFQHGPNIDAEGKSPEAHYGFICTFTDRAALDRYAADPRHHAVGARLVGLCGGAQKIKVYDIDTAKDR